MALPNVDGGLNLLGCSDLSWYSDSSTASIEHDIATLPAAISIRGLGKLPNNVSLEIYRFVIFFDTYLNFFGILFFRLTPVCYPDLLSMLIQIEDGITIHAKVA